MPETTTEPEDPWKGCPPGSGALSVLSYVAAAVTLLAGAWAAFAKESWQLGVSAAGAAWGLIIAGRILDYLRAMLATMTALRAQCDTADP